MRQSWLLMSAEDIAKIIVSNNQLFRKQKSYYNKRGNVVMMLRITDAENIAKTTLAHTTFKSGT